MSGDGAVIVGSGTRGEAREAFRWTDGSGMVGLGFLPGGTTSEAMDISQDGRVIVGYSSSSLETEPFRWTSEAGMVGLGQLPGSSFAAAAGVSADGAMIVGVTHSSVLGIGDEAFVWDESHGMRRLQTVLETDYGLNLRDWTLQSATDISPDARPSWGTASIRRARRKHGWQSCRSRAH